MRCHEAKSAVLMKIEGAEFGIADANGLLKHGRKYRLKIARRAAEMTWSTSDVAVCCSSDYALQVHSASRAFSIAITAWAAKS